MSRCWSAASNCGRSGASSMNLASQPAAEASNVTTAVPRRRMTAARVSTS